ncbi:MAG: hypothetical protein Kow0062_24180 [Acidobacteriota bacterium]|nr:MAG: hypothetical protein D6738_02270 [Acidobacteriota bacterium]
MTPGRRRPVAGGARRPGPGLPEPPAVPELAVELPAGVRLAVGLSHDVDHLGLREHLVDRFLLSTAFNALRQNLAGRFRPWRAADQLAGLALAALGRDRWDTIDELREFEQAAGIRSTWFFAARPGLGIRYALADAAATIRRLADAGFEIGLHGQSADDPAALAAEFADLRRIVPRPVDGLRMHYLRLSAAVVDGMAQGGARYDSTVMDRDHRDPDTHPLAAPCGLRTDLVELPLHVMDSTLFSVTGFGLSEDDALDWTLRLARRAESLGRVLVINLHPNYYSRQTPEIRRWYRRLVGALTARSDVLVTGLGELCRLLRDPR